MNEWLPIESAPEDTVILVLGPNGVSIAALSGGYDWFAYADGELCYDGGGDYPMLIRATGPTHWMPLPSPPGDAK